MKCTHHALKRVNGVFYCDICGARVNIKKPAEAQEGAKAAPTEGVKKRKGRKDDEV